MTSVLSVIFKLLDLYELIIVIWCVMTWFPTREDSFFYDLKQVVSALVLPFLRLFRRILPTWGNIDFSPVVAVLVLEILKQALMVLR